MREPIFNETSDHRRPRCGCGRFVANVRAQLTGEGGIGKVMADCKRHGRVEAFILGGWWWEDFFGWR
jgi:hypothetical protein